jgi:hypothetical protein
VGAATADLTKMALTDLEVASTAPVAAAQVIWIEKLRIDHGAGFRVNASKAFKAAALIAPAADSAVIASVVVADSGAIDLVAGGDLAAAALADLAEAAAEDSAAAGSGADDDN